MSETWKDIEGYEGIYQISDKGRVKSLPRKDEQGHSLKEKFLRQYTTPTGRKQVFLYKDRKLKGFFVHRLVAEAFLGSSELTVNHIDEDPSNNCVENLEYMTLKDNCNYGHRNTKIALANSKRGRPIGYTENGITFVFNSVADAARKLGKPSDTSIRDCVNGKQHTAYGHHFFYIGGI